jgi:hypothetical protein
LRWRPVIAGLSLITFGKPCRLLRSGHAALCLLVLTGTAALVFSRSHAGENIPARISGKGTRI